MSNERLRHLEAAETYLAYNGDPNGLVDAAEGMLLWDYSTDTLWANTDGVTTWQSIGGGAPPPALPHNLLSATHSDTDPAAVSRGSLVVGDATPEWAELPHPAVALRVLTTNATDALWSANTLDIAGNSVINGSLVGNLSGGGTIATGGFTGTLPKTGTFPVGTGVVGRVAEWVTDVNTLQASTLAKTGAGVLTLAAAGAYTATIAATGTVALGAGTLTAATANDVTGATHTHAITSTSDGDTNVSTILASDANGGLRLDRLGVGVASLAVSGTIALPNAGYIGNGAATAQLGFDSSGATNYAIFSQCYVGVNEATPERRLTVTDNNITAKFTRTSALTAVGLAAFDLRATSTGDMADGFGATILFSANDATETGLNILARVGGVRDGADNEGALLLYAGTAGNEIFARIRATGNFLIGTATDAAQLVVDQSSTTAAEPVLELDQADVSEEYINFVTAATGAGDPVDTATAVGAAYARLRVAVNGTFKYIQLYNA